MPSYKLTYFDARGRAEICRLLFALAGQEFEDIRIKREEWPVLKNSTPFGQLPLLEVDGKVYAQSVALSNFLARRFGFYGKTDTDGLAVDQVVCLVQDFVNLAARVFHEAEPAKKEELTKSFKEVELPKLLGFCEKLLKANGTGYFVGGSLTLADLITWNFITGIENRMKVSGLADGFPVVRALFQKVENADKIKTYLANRKPTDF
ncbi:unnamed protein product [Lymnaea stagnalis]|uniref:Uncharacterized protein n=1 Tax=Lymnaea stagnalis TaxID=6523 RepID=A0AAV2IQM5_LYMST